MYIEPCCADRQLPQLLKAAQTSQGGFAFFQTGGDVTVKKLMESVSSMAGPDHVMLLAIPQVSIPILRTLKFYLSRGWTRALLLLTQDTQTDLVTSELHGYEERLQYAADRMIIDGLMAFVGSAKAVVIQGAMLGEADFSLSHYAGWAGRNPETLRQAIDPLLSKLQTKPLIDHRETNADIQRALSRRFFE